jgi:hypothetical protein
MRKGQDYDYHKWNIAMVMWHRYSVMVNQVMVIEDRLRAKLYDKRDDFNFPIVNFPFMCSNIPAAPVFVVYISQLIWYSRACGSYDDFFDRELLVTRKLLNQGFLVIKLKSSLRTFYGRHHDLVWDIYYKYGCCWNVATHKWKVHNGEIEIISFVV